MSLRKRFCKKFNFELQAAATEDAIILSLGSTHSFSLEEVFHYLKSVTVKDVLIQALLDSPMFEIRWIWNASCALALLRRKAGQRVPPQLQRMQAEDLVALVFPDQLACFENIQGEREVPDHPLVNQTIHDCLTEAMNIDKLQEILKNIEENKLELHAKDLREPSPLAQEILTARPYAFLDDAPLEERRTRAVMSRNWMDPSEATDLSRLDKAAIELVKNEAWPSAENMDELHDALNFLGFITEEEGLKESSGYSWEVYFYELVRSGRATVFHLNDEKRLWICVERIPQLEKIFAHQFKISPDLSVPDRIREQDLSREKSITEIIRGRMEAAGPLTEEDLHKQSGIGKGDIHQALLALEAEGFIFRGKFNPDGEELQWCERRLLARIHRYTLERLRKEIEAVSPADFMRFLFDWQHISEESKLEGPVALDKVLGKLEGFEAAAASWEADILPSRIKDFDFSWLDFSCISGKTVWGRFRLSDGENKKANPVKSTPVMLVSRYNAALWKNCLSADTNVQLSNPAEKIFNALLSKGALFFDDIVKITGLLPSQAEDSIAELVSLGLLTSDSYAGLRALLVPEKYKLPSSGRKQSFNVRDAGRWTLLHNNQESCDEKAMTELTARMLLKRYIRKSVFTGCYWG